MGGLKARVSAGLASARAARPGLDHVVRMQGRMSRTRGSMLAGSVTYSAFVSIFPILLLAVSVLGFVLAGNEDAQRSVLGSVTKVIPGDLGKNLLDSVQSAKAATGIIGLVGTAVSGLGWLSSLRTSVRLVWSQEDISENAVLAKLQDALTLLGFAVLLVLSTGAATVATGQAKHIANGLVGSDAPGLGVLLQVLGYVLAIAANFGLFFFMYLRLSRINHPRRRFVQGSLLSAVAVWALQSVLFFVIQRSLNSSSQVYGATIGGFFALLLYIRYITLIILYSAAWMATGPGDDDRLPSGTSLLEVGDDEVAQLMGITVEKAEAVREKLATSEPGGLTSLPEGGTVVRPEHGDDHPSDPADSPARPAEGPVVTWPVHPGTPLHLDAEVQDPGERPALARLAYRDRGDAR